MRHQLLEALAVALDAEEIRKRQRYFPFARARDFSGAHERRLRLVAVEEVALQKQNCTRADQIGVDVAGGEKGGGAEIGAHRALAVRRHSDKAARRARLAVTRGRVEGNARGAELAREPGAQIIVCDLADIAGAPAEA